MKFKPAYLALENGIVFEGRSGASSGCAIGEVVFNTATTGYQELFTDPSYRQQLVALTSAHVGNTGINTQDYESDQAWLSGCIVRHVSECASHYNQEMTLMDYLLTQNVPCLTDIDTRHLTNILRSEGTLMGCLLAGDDATAAAAAAHLRQVSAVSSCALIESVAHQKVTAYPSQQQGPHVVVYDFGVKRSILKHLVERGCRVTLVPYTSTVDAVLQLKPDGIVLSNGPGNPADLSAIVDEVQTLLSMHVPLFGICLGHQLLALASGAKTFHMKFGHHGANHPVQDIATGRVMITSQNHGFAVDQSTLPDSVALTHISLFDRTVQGLRWNNKPFFSFQGHPEAGPGPRDAFGLFDQFVANMKG